MTTTTSQTMKKQPVVAVPGVVAGRGPDLEDSAAVVRPPAYVRGTDRLSEGEGGGHRRATGGDEQRQDQERGGLESDVRRDQGREDAKGPELEERAAVVHPPASIAYGRYGALLASLKGKDMVRREGDRAVLVR